MNKKQFLWFLLAAVIFVGAGWFGVRSAVNAHLTTLAIRKSAEADGKPVFIKGMELSF